MASLHCLLWSALPILLCSIYAQCEQRPLSLAISAQENVLKIGGTVRIEVLITNTSDRQILIQERNPATDYEIDVRDQRGLAVRETDYGRKAKEPPMIPMNSRNIGIYLQPQEATKENVNLSDLYDLSHPGRFTIQLQRPLPKELGSGLVKSNVITITVAE